MNKFPHGFFFGAATSSHQVEGGCINNWSEWEKKNAFRLSEEYSEQNVKLSFRNSTDGLKADNYISGSSVDHYNRFDDDFNIAEKIGLNAYRFSVEWSRIEPFEGEFNKKEINHYKNVIRNLREKKIEPFVTVWHWTLPLWLADSGGILNKKFPYYFSRYASKLAESFGDSVKFYITINEPEIYSLNSYMLGKWPPQKKGIIQYMHSIDSLIEAHKKAFSAIKNTAPYAISGPACNMTYFESGGGFLNNLAVKAANKFWNRYFIDKIIPDIDFIGLNYYFHNRIRYGFNKNLNNNLSDMGWEIYPEGIGHLLENLKDYSLPVYITENGLADAEDKDRAWFIEETLKEIYKSILNGSDVRGYFHWSLLDNFEWDKGFWPRFGLVSVDRTTMKRTLRGSALIYKKIIKKGLSI